MKKAFVVLLMAASASTVFAQAPASTAASQSRAEAYYHFATARMLDEEGKSDQAIDEYKKALALDPNNSDIYSEMADAYLRYRRVTDAVDAAEKAVQLDPDNAAAHQLLSDVYMNLIANSGNQQPSRQNIDKAIHEFEEIVRISTREQRPYLMLGRLYQAINQPDKAAEIYRKYLGVEPGSEDGVMALARLHLDSDNSQAAVDLLETFVKDRPDADRAWEALGEAYGNLDQNGKAADAYKKAIELGADDATLKSEYAQALFLDRQFTEAGKAYEEVLAADPSDPLTLLRLGQIARQQMKYDQARSYLQKAAGLAPSGNLEIQFHLALLDRDEGQFDDSLQRITDILKKTERPNGVYSEAERQNRRLFLTHQAMVDNLLTHYDQAVQAFENLKAISEDKGRVDAMIVDTYRGAKENDKATERLQTSMKENPDSRDLQMQYADMIAEKGRVDEGIKILQKLSQGDESDLELTGAMAEIYERAKKFDQAQSVIEAAIRKFPAEQHGYFLQGALYERQKKYNEAEQAFRKALDLDKDNPATLNYLGYMLTERGVKMDEALSMIQKAVESDPTSGAYLDSLGWIYFKMGRLDQAELYLKKAVRFAATSATMHDHLADLYYKQGRYPEAAAAWTKALPLSTESDETEKIRKKLDQVKAKVAKK